VLASARHHGPLTVQRPFYPEEDVCHLYLLHPPAGIVGGDELHIAVTLDENSHALITQPGAGKFYRSRGPQALLRQHFTLASHATLEWLPQDTILFPGANAAIQTVFHLTSASRLLAWDLLCLGRPVMQETFSHGTLQNRLEVWRDGLPLLIERLILQEESERRRASSLGRHVAVLSGQRTHAGGHAGAAYGAWRLRRGNA
jgi:urease accessory protein